MAALSVQLAMYGIAWLILGLSFRLKRKVAVLWGTGWFCGALSAAILYFNTLTLPLSRDLVVNILSVGMFLLLRRGVEDFTGHVSRRWDYLVLAAGLLLIEALRFQGDSSTLPRVLIYTAVAIWPLVAMGWRIATWSRAHNPLSRVVVFLMVSPVVVTVGLFLLRALLVWHGADQVSVSFEAGTDFDLLVTLIFLVVLGSFNFSLASLVLGGMAENLRRLSETDQLTGLANRRMMMRCLADEHARFLRSGQAYSVAMLDLDHFKIVNDTHGHGVGDQVLRGLAKALRANQRRTDTVARTGGEEFLLLMPMTDAPGALVQARRIVESIAITPIHTDVGSLHVTVSVGVAITWDADATADAVVSRADAALYMAKAAGRNQALVAEPA